ncbi:hypothetical protein AGOR_G00168430 [Albula goreensis]|uniref:Ig-like domain-containing protein n=1 Tax=Albula goreensis TaxID=1534307 RepID=A0A8T3D2R3_9TELE|nr:hypothetical protein AGOR_G00168430 [Albula goreensis]
MVQRHSTEMRSFCISAIIGFVLVQQPCESAEWKGIKLGDNVTLGCNISYEIETTWLRHTTDQLPTVLMVNSPIKTDLTVFSKNTLSNRFTSVPNAENETTELRISNVIESDLALYYCVGRLQGILQFGKGTRLYREPSHEADPQAPKQDLSSQSSFPSFYMIYASLLGLGQLGMICAVFTVHVRTRGTLNPDTVSIRKYKWKLKWRYYKEMPFAYDGDCWHFILEFYHLLSRPSVSIRFPSRVSLPVERIKQGNFSLTINSVQLSDDNHYECYWKKGKPSEKFLEDVRLTVLEPSFSNNVSVSTGDQVTLPCYFRISRQTPDEKLFVQWKVGDEVVLQLASGEFTYGSKFRSRVDISLERIRQGNLSLHLRNTSQHDSGDYQCSIKNKNVVITLEVKDASRTSASPPQRYYPVQYLVIAFLLVVII